MSTPDQRRHLERDGVELACGSRGGDAVFHYETLEHGTITRFWRAASQNTGADPNTLVHNGDFTYTGDCQHSTVGAAGTWFDHLSYNGGV